MVEVIGRRSGRPVDFAVKAEMPTVDLGGIHDGILADHHMRHPPLADLQRSYDAGMAAVAVDSKSGEVVGFVRLMERLHPGLYGSIGLPTNGLPNVYEIGSGFVLRERQGEGFYTPLRNHLLEQHAENNNMLVVGITNNVQVLRALQKAPQVGVTFEAMAFTLFHDGFQMTTQFFCSCDPEPEATVMIKIPGCPIGNDDPTFTLTGTSKKGLDAILRDATYDEKGTMPFYTVYWSNQSLLTGLDTQLEGHFEGRSDGTRPHKTLRDALRQTGYYHR